MRHEYPPNGVTRQLALLDPPIDPELLIRAHLAGIDIDDVLADRFVPPESAGPFDARPPFYETITQIRPRLTDTVLA